MRVEGRDLVDFGEREPHLLGERREMRGGEAAVAVLDQMQVLDQKVAPALALAQQRAHLLERARIDLAPLRRSGRLAPPAARLVVDRVNGVLSVSFPSPQGEGQIAGGDPGWGVRDRSQKSNIGRKCLLPLSDF